MRRWRSIGVCSGTGFHERLSQAGLNHDGSKCIIFDCDETFFVWDVNGQRVLWDEEDASEDLPPVPGLNRWLADGWIELNHRGAADGRYEVFGLQHEHAARCRTEDMELRLDIARSSVHFVPLALGGEVQELQFAQDSGDWAYAAFCADGSTVAVIEPYNVSFFRAE